MLQDDRSQRPAARVPQAAGHAQRPSQPSARPGQQYSRPQTSQNSRFAHRRASQPPPAFPAASAPGASTPLRQYHHPPNNHANWSRTGFQASEASRPRPHAANMTELTIQLMPDLSSIMLLEPDAGRCHAAFQGHQPPGHHHHTALHSYLDHICPFMGGSFADVWLDTAHVTFATLQLPTDKLQMFTASFTKAAAQLPPLSSESYTITGLALQKKPSRHEKHIKGDSFYYLDLESATAGFEGIQKLWLEALRSTARQCGGRCVDERSMQRQHMTIRSFSLRTAAGNFDRVAQAVRLNPATMQCAGLRIQQSVDDAMNRHTGQGIIAHGYLHSLVVRYPVPLYSSCAAASQIITLADRQRRMQQAALGTQEAVINGMQAMQLAT